MQIEKKGNKMYYLYFVSIYFRKCLKGIYEISFRNYYTEYVKTPAKWDPLKTYF